MVSGTAAYSHDHSLKSPKWLQLYGFIIFCTANNLLKTLGFLGNISRCNQFNREDVLVEIP